MTQNDKIDYNLERRRECFQQNVIARCFHLPEDETSRHGARFVRWPQFIVFSLTNTFQPSRRKMLSPRSFKNKVTRDDSALHFYGSKSVIEWCSSQYDQRLVIQGKFVRLVLVKMKRHIEVVFRVTKTVLKRQEFLTAFHTCVCRRSSDDNDFMLRF